MYTETRTWFDSETLVKTGHNQYAIYWDLYISGKNHIEIHFVKSGIRPSNKNGPYVLNEKDFARDYIQEVGCPVFDY